MSVNSALFLYFPVKNGKWLTDSIGKVRVYKSLERAVKENKDREYDNIEVFMLDDVLSREGCERWCGQ